MTESSSDIAVQDDGAGDEGDHLRFANSATSSQRASITVNPGQQVDEIQIRSRQVSGGSGVMAFYVDGTASGNKVATFTPADGTSFTTQTLTLSSPMSAGSHTIYLGPNATLNAVQ
jgi:hypothetical protein